MDFYLIPGLGFDERIFSNITLPDHTLHFLNWIDPLPNEGLKEYASRLAAGIDKKERGIYLIGHSFGGILCQEIAKIRSTKQIFLISSIISRAENPLKFKILQPLLLHKWVSRAVILKTFPLWADAQGYDSPELKHLFKQMVQNQSNTYLKWALKNLSEWKNTPVPPATKITRIHGSRDKTFPINRIKYPEYLVEDGDHLVVYKEGKLISKLIEKALKIPLPDE